MRNLRDLITSKHESIEYFLFWKKMTYQIMLWKRLQNLGKKKLKVGKGTI
jgi:hypothetical protein